LKAINRKPIQVRGGILFSNYHGIARVVTEDGLSCLLKNTLLVLKLDINLISARRLYKDRIKGRFDTENIYFKRDNKIIIQAQQNNSLYLIKTISKDCLDKVFLATQDSLLYKANNSTDLDESKEDKATRNNYRYYRLIY
jgi:hypothetical protein